MKKIFVLIAFLIAVTPLTANSVGNSSNSEPEYQIRFGWMKQREDGSYYVYKETRTIALLLKETGFRWGYTIHSRNLFFTTSSIDYGPSEAQLKPGDDPELDRKNQLITMGPTRVYDGQYWRWTANDPEDPLGHQKIEIYINGKLYQTIHFTIVKPDALTAEN